MGENLKIESRSTTEIRLSGTVKIPIFMLGVCSHHVLTVVVEDGVKFITSNTIGVFAKIGSLPAGTAIASDPTVVAPGV